MFPTVPVKAALAAVAVVALIVAGWTTRGWFEDAKENARLEAEIQHRMLMTELANTVAKNTETAIGRIKIENRTIQTEVQREIVEKPVYRECRLTPDGVRGANQARRGSAAGKPDGKVPAASTSP